MKIDQFKAFVVEALQGREGITIDTYSDSGQENPVLTCADGTKYYLTLVRTSPPGGDREDAETVTRPAGVPIEVRSREQAKAH